MKNARARRAKRAKPLLWKFEAFLSPTSLRLIKLPNVKTPRDVK